MLFLISLLIAAVFSVFCGETVRKRPAPFYIAAAVLSIGTVCAAQFRITGIPAPVQNYLIAPFTKGTLAAAFWAVVMWTGALPNGSALMKKLMPPRGQLSIFAGILTLGHAVGLGISMLPRWIEKADILNLSICIVLMVIMLPLTVISVRAIRNKMKAKTWKSVQRTAYVFYAFIPLHVIALNFARARGGHKEAFFNLLVYLAVFLGYAVCRLRKAYIRKAKPERHAGLNIAAGSAFVLLFAVLASAAMPEKKPETVQTEAADIAVQTDITETTAAAETSAGTETTKTTTAKTSEAATETTSEAVTDITDTTEETSAVTEQNTAEAVQEAEAPVTEAAAEDTPQATAPPDAPAPQTEAPVETAAPEIQRMYQNGTFTASAFGYDGNIIVHVTIQDDRIIDITAETEEVDASYFLDAKNVVIPAIINSQSPDVDALSGATYSSNAIMTAVRTAMESARS